VALLLLLLKLVMTRCWDRVFAAGFSALPAISVSSAAVSATGWWVVSGGDDSALSRRKDGIDQYQRT
jgi:hypothetical protein